MTFDEIVDVLRVAIAFVGGVVGPVLFTVGFGLVGVIRRSRTFLILAGANTIALWIARSVATPVGVVIWIASVALTWIGIFQEPLWLARRLGFVRRSIPFEFDRRLGEVIGEFNEVLRRANEPPLTDVESHALRKDGERVLRALRSLVPPDAGWTELVHDYEQLFLIDLESLIEVPSEEQRQRFTELSARMPGRLERLREAYRIEAAARFHWP